MIHRHKLEKAGKLKYNLLRFFLRMKGELRAVLSKKEGQNYARGWS